MSVDATLFAGPTTRAFGSSARGEFDVTVLVPTRNERDNVAPLLRRLEKIRPDLRLQVLFIDDSSDDTACMIEEEARRCSRTVSLIHRPEGERSGGLGGAVRAGLLAAGSDLVCVMDADLQHPPELLAALIDEASRSQADVVVASRYCERGNAGGFSAFRRRLVELRVPRRWRRLAGFAAVGALGVAVNTAVLALLSRTVHVWYLVATILATQIAILTNFALAEWLVFRGAHSHKSLRFRFASYLLISDTSLLITGPLLLLLVSAIGMDLLLANVLLLALLVLARFAIADSYIWGGKLAVERSACGRSEIGGDGDDRPGRPA